jgi:hypothetical protein
VDLATVILREGLILVDHTGLDSGIATRDRVATRTCWWSLMRELRRQVRLRRLASVGSMEANTLIPHIKRIDDRAGAELEEFLNSCALRREDDETAAETDMAIVASLGQMAITKSFDDDSMTFDWATVRGLLCIRQGEFLSELRRWQLALGDEV